MLIYRNVYTRDASHSYILNQLFKWFVASDDRNKATAGLRPTAHVAHVNAPL
ncbi:MAG: hypothetical protein DHS20C11_17860 [Lysobacteraceae bacterium]|nr:MAG: hypothetical protein DHS20C11_17860 [Xanthomonadaceae bacterium]